MVERQFTIARALDRLQSGETNYATFIRETERDWTKLAAYIMRRWSTPQGVELGDVVQELHVAAFRMIPRFDPAKGSSLARYVVWNAVSAAKKWVHGQRGVSRHGNPDARPSWFPACESELSFALGDSDDESKRVSSLMERGQAADAGQHALVESREMWRAITSQIVDSRMRAAIDAVERHGAEGAADALYGDPAVRLRFRFGSKRDAGTMVEEVFSHVAKCAAA